MLGPLRAPVPWVAMLALTACGAPSGETTDALDARAVATASAVPAPSPPRLAPSMVPWFIVPPVNAPVIGKGPFPSSNDRRLLDPSAANGMAPPEFRIVFRTSAGTFEAQCHRDWAPNGADRLYNLVRMKFYDDVGFFRVVSSPTPFVAQFGIHGDPSVNAVWREARLPPDPVVGSNTRGTITFAMAGSADTRTTQLFINLADNKNLDALGFAPVCEIVDGGMDAVGKIHGGYGERPSSQQEEIQTKGNAFLRAKYPDLDYIASARVQDEVPADPRPDRASASGVPHAAEVVRAMAPDLRACYEAGLADDREMQGTLEITIEIGPGGRVQSTSVSGGGTLSPTAIACMRARVARAEFGPPESGHATLILPVTFQPID